MTSFSSIKRSCFAHSVVLQSSLLQGFLKGAAFSLALSLAGPLAASVSAQERFPEDKSMFGYHEAPAYRESESHPLRLVGYVLHPVGWLAKEVIFRPLSYFMSSTETTRTVFGYRNPHDFRQPECFSSDATTPACNLYPPFNYQRGESVSALADSQAGSDATQAASMASSGERQVFLPDVNFEFNRSTLNALGEGRVRQIAELLKREPNLSIVLEGNTDAKGADVYNEKLGLERAEMVRAKLVDLGVSTERLSTVSFGKSRPVFSDEAAWAHAVNRRVSAQPVVR